MPSCLTSGIASWDLFGGPFRQFELWRTDLECVELLLEADTRAGGRAGPTGFFKVCFERYPVTGRASCYATRGVNRVSFWWRNCFYLRTPRAFIRPAFPGKLEDYRGSLKIMATDIVTAMEFLSFVEWFRSEVGFLVNPGVYNFAYCLMWLVLSGPNFYAAKRRQSWIKFYLYNGSRAVTAALLAWKYGVKMERAVEVALATTSDSAIKRRAVQSFGRFASRPEATVADMAQLACSFPVAVRAAIPRLRLYAGEVEYPRPDPLQAIRDAVTEGKAAGYVSTWDASGWRESSKDAEAEENEDGGEGRTTATAAEV